MLLEVGLVGGSFAIGFFVGVKAERRKLYPEIGQLRKERLDLRDQLRAMKYKYEDSRPLEPTRGICSGILEGAISNGARQVFGSTTRSSSNVSSDNESDPLVMTTDISDSSSTSRKRSYSSSRSSTRPSSNVSSDNESDLLVMAANYASDISDSSSTTRSSSCDSSSYSSSSSSWDSSSSSSDCGSCSCD